MEPYERLKPLIGVLSRLKMRVTRSSLAWPFLTFSLSLLNQELGHSSATTNRNRQKFGAISQTRMTWRVVSHGPRITLFRTVQRSHGPVLKNHHEELVLRSSSLNYNRSDSLSEKDPMAKLVAVRVDTKSAEAIPCRQADKYRRSYPCP